MNRWQYTAAMPVDVAAHVIENRPLSADHNVVLLAAPAIAAAAQPGQFVMLKAATGRDPLLRRPFSIFEILRGADGTPAGISIFSKRVGASSGALYDVHPGRTVACLGPLGRPWPLVEAPAEAWMVAGGVGLAAFGTLAAALRARGVKTTLFYGARTGSELFCLDRFSNLGATLVLATEDGTVGELGRVVVPLERQLAARRPEPAVVMYACGPEAMMAATARLAVRFDTPCEVSMERIMGCGLGGCYSCVVAVKNASGGTHYVRSCLEGPVMAGHEVVWS